MPSRKPVSEADLDAPLGENVGELLDDLRALTRRVEGAGVEGSANLRRIVTLLALAEAAASLAKAIARRLSMAEDQQDW